VGCFIKGKGRFVEIDIAAWLSTNGYTRKSTVPLKKVVRGTLMGFWRGESTS
jgi:hypothetical protein